MPCYRCGARQSDPEPGKPSPWKRGVRREHQVLICPDCAADADADLDRCPGCGGTHLIRRLDQVECLGCGAARETSPQPGSATPAAGALLLDDPADPAPGALADEVASALNRVLRRGQGNGGQGSGGTLFVRAASA